MPALQVQHEALWPALRMIRYKRHPLFLTLVLLAVTIRTSFGCAECMPFDWGPMDAAHAHANANTHAHMGHDAGHHAQHHAADHSGHNLTEGAIGAVGDAGAGDNGKPGQHSAHDAHDSQSCCSACGPTLPPQLAQFGPLGERAQEAMMPPIRALATRPPFPAYEARGPPLLS